MATGYAGIPLTEAQYGPIPGLDHGGASRHPVRQATLAGARLLVNLTVDRPFEYRLLYRLTSLTLQCGGILVLCNREIAMFAFPSDGVIGFMEEAGFKAPIARTLVSRRDAPNSIVNVRFK